MLTNDPVTGQLYDESSSASDVTGGSDGGDSLFSQLGGLFSNLGTTIATDYRAISGPQMIQPGATYINPQTGLPVTAGQSIFGQSSNGFFFIALIGIALLILFMRR
jgi:hypothetical protein